jgi:hypothetical protein
MKKLIILLVVILAAVPGCKDKKTADYTWLGDSSPYNILQDKLKGKVASVTEKAYWAVPEGDKFIKGAKMTRKELDSLAATYDFTAVYDADGYMLSCVTTDENDKTIGRWDMTKTGNEAGREEYRSGDTLRRYVNVRYNDKGRAVLYEVFNAIADTLIQKIEFTGRDHNDTTIIIYLNHRGEVTMKGFEITNDMRLTVSAEEYGPDGSYRGGVQMKYNDKGFLSELNSLDPGKNIAETYYITYEYDDHGNWVTGIWTSSHDSMAIFTERVYTYFK